MKNLNKTPILPSLLGESEDSLFQKMDLIDTLPLNLVNFHQHRNQLDDCSGES